MNDAWQAVRSGADPDEYDHNQPGESQSFRVDPQEPASGSGIGERAIAKVAMGNEEFSSDSS